MSEPKQKLRVLVANRGEIAVRLHRGLRSLGHETVAVYSEADRGTPFVRAATTAVEIGPPPPNESYLVIERLIEAGRRTGANAVHPGYGFLSENASFAEAVEAEGWTFLGPTAETIAQMGDKTRAREIAESAGVPVVPSCTPEKEEAPAQLAAAASNLGLPLMIKAAAGGGGKGMRIVHELDQLEEAIGAAVREAEGAFGDGRIFMERYLEKARHVEVQVVGDGQGGAVSLGERDCSMQRRHQKLVEESPAPQLGNRVRDAMARAARALVERTNYRGAGTVEFLVGPDKAFYFLEMNTRLQVEHPVTECVHQLDLVAAQVAVATRAELPPETEPVGHAIEIRVYAENPETGFLPSIGVCHEVVWPSGPGIRVDSGIERGSEVTMYYDPLLAKIIAWGEDRDAAIERMRAALAETFIAGVETNVGYCRDLIDHPAFRSGDVHTGFLAEDFAEWKRPTLDDSEDPGHEWRSAAAAFAKRPEARQGDGFGGAPSGPPSLWESLPGWRHA